MSEDAISAVGAKVACAKCGNASTVYGTVFYVEKLVERYFAALRELAALERSRGAHRCHRGRHPGATDRRCLQHRCAGDGGPAPAPAGLAGAPDSGQFLPQCRRYHRLFDEAAKAIGDGYELFAELMERVRFSYRKELFLVEPWSSAA